MSPPTGQPAAGPARSMASDGLLRALLVVAVGIACLLGAALLLAWATWEP